MPRKDQAVRQLVILTKLDASRHGLTLGQLAESIDPAAIRHPRTLRRDLAAIEAVGWPLVTGRVEGQVRWKLLEGFRNIPALRLSPTELMALTAHCAPGRNGTSCIAAIGPWHSFCGIASTGVGVGSATRTHLFRRTRSA